MPDNIHNNIDENDTSIKPLHDKVTKDKIDKHLSDINDTISEQDIKNIKTSSDDVHAIPDRHPGERNEIDDKPSDNDEPEKEAPTPWEILE